MEVDEITVNNPVMPCTFCHTVLHDGLKQIRLRVPGTASSYQNTIDHLCAECIKRNRGSYKLVLRPT